MSQDNDNNVVKDKDGIAYHPIMPVYPDRTILSGGQLPDTIAAHACWNYCGRAMRALEAYDQGRVYESDVVMKDTLWGLAIGVSKQYRLDSPAEMFVWMRACKLEAFGNALPWDKRIEKPKRYQHSG